MEEIRVQIGTMTIGDTTVIVSAACDQRSAMIDIWFGSGRRNGELVRLDSAKFAAFADLLARAKQAADHLAAMGPGRLPGR